MERKNNKPDVSKAQLDKLILNYQRTVKKIRGDSDLASDYDPNFDSNSVWFTRKAVEELFNENDADGLRVYFGVHDSKIMDTEYDGQLMVVLVATKYIDGKNVDQLKDRDQEDENDGPIQGGPGYGLNHGSVCPPNCP